MRNHRPEKISVMEVWWYRLFSQGKMGSPKKKGALRQAANALCLQWPLAR
jgi:hypothetical protein